jgi:hypothetical protein
VRRQQSLQIALVAIVAMLGSPTRSASGGQLCFGLCLEYSGACKPAGERPWLTAIFTDGGSPGSVELTLDAGNLCDGEYVGVWMFNVDPALADDLASMQMDLAAEGCEGTFDVPDVYISADAYRADGDGYFDIKIEFSNQDGGMAHRFSCGDKATYAISGIDSLTADSFDFISEPNGGAGEHRCVSHVMGIGEDSAWVTTPEPAVLCILAGGFVALLRRRR